MSTSLPYRAAIFDMDGTIVNNTPFHFRAWQQLFKLHNLPELTKETYLNQISGVPIINTVHQFFGSKADEEFAKQLADEKQKLYQEAFKPFLQPLTGLESFLSELKKAGIKIALATSSNENDIDFIFHDVAIGKYFDVLVTGGMVNEPKPSPQIFLKAALQLNVDPHACVVFEDSLAGLRAGKNAGMKVAGITTSHKADAISGLADIVFDNYSELNLQKLAALFN
ncbi:HAD family phosphatase [Mucilaginibacter sp. 21P]|uniref:HAD family hydrolase n=1 Tax=Mucilaginibacter sp. 21P TaxID=2778902 RepID=UPI001C597566|nr:HAD family phosphatase [Mucilaginibacter sp. 21P]QXV65364.1 HAD family phosphatase [Mucilaginibacter sp. 21P]